MFFSNSDINLTDCFASYRLSSTSQPAVGHNGTKVIDAGFLYPMRTFNLGFQWKASFFLRNQNQGAANAGFPFHEAHPRSKIVKFCQLINFEAFFTAFQTINLANVSWDHPFSPRVLFHHKYFGDRFYLRINILTQPLSLWKLFVYLPWMSTRQKQDIPVPRGLI